MKVLHINAGLEKGGGLSHIVNLLTEAKRQNVDFELLTLADGPVAKAAKKAKIKTTILGAQSRYDLSVLKRLTRLINEGNFDIVHTHGARANLFVSMIKKQIKAKWIITVHSDPLKDFEGRGMIGNIFTKLNIMALKKADGIFAITQNFSDLLVEKVGIPKTKICVIYNGIFFHDNKELPKKIVIGLDDSFPPMGFKDDKGEIVGLDIDMAKEAAKRAGMEVEFKAIDWSSKEAELKSKKIDALWNGLTVSPEREKNILFSNTYMKDKQYIVIRNDDESIKSKADLAGKVVGVQQASTGESALQNDPSGKTVKETKSYADFVSAFMDLGIGRVDAVIADGVIARYLMTKEPGKYKIVEGTDYGVDNFAVGFRKDDTALRDKINGILAEMKKDGTADKIVEKWLGSSADLDKSDAK